MAFDVGHVAWLPHPNLAQHLAWQPERAVPYSGIDGTYEAVAL
jgi:hypothetical protein